MATRPARSNGYWLGAGYQFGSELGAFLIRAVRAVHARRLGLALFHTGRHEHGPRHGLLDGCPDALLGDHTVFVCAVFRRWRRFNQHFFRALRTVHSAHGHWFVAVFIWFHQRICLRGRHRLNRPTRERPPQALRLALGYLLCGRWLWHDYLRPVGATHADTGCRVGHEAPLATWLVCAGRNGPADDLSHVETQCVGACFTAAQNHGLPPGIFALVWATSAT
jgi:hypothetical protein